MFEIEKGEIRTLFNTQKSECLNRCFQLLKEIKNSSDFNIKYFCNYFIARIHYDMEHYDVAIKYAKITKTYVESISDRMRINWLISCYYEKVNVQKALEFIEYAIKDCCEIQNEENLYTILVHKAFLLNDVTLAIDAINNLKGFNIDNDKFDEIYQDLFMIYYHNSQLVKAQNVLKNIKNINMKTRLLENIYKQSAVINV